jgi:regulator of nucleoside diphosphate kinase
MENQPAIIMSALDWERLNNLLVSPEYRRLPGIDALRAELDRATIVEPSDVPPGVVTMNSTVRFRDDASHAEYELTLVYPDARGGANSVSILAPVGSALLGLSVGQSISWRIPGGRELQVRVLAVVRQPEAEGEFHR